MTVLRLGTRASVLARTQSATVGDAWSALTGRPWQEVTITTAGDDTSKPLDQPGRPGVFVSALRDALLAGDVDVIVHSFKDLPSAPHSGIALAAVPGREDARDALVSRDGLRLDELPAGAVVGTSSPRRAFAITALRPDVQVRPIRGNVDSRIRKVREGEFDASVLALAGMRRIGRADEASQVFTTTEMTPAPAQGALAVECRADDTALLTELARLDDPGARLLVSAERAVLVGVDAACTTAVGASAHIDGDRMTLRAFLAEHRGVSYGVSKISVPLAGVDPVALGMRAAEALLAMAD